MPVSKRQLPGFVVVAVCSGNKEKGPCSLLPYSDDLIRLDYGLGWVTGGSSISVLGRVLLPCIRELIRLQETQRVSHDKTASRIVAVGNASGMPIFSRLNHYQTVILSLSLGGQQEFCILLSEDGVQPWASLTHTPYHVLSTKSHLLSTNPTEMQWLRPHLMGLL